MECDSHYPILGFLALCAAYRLSWFRMATIVNFRQLESMEMILHFDLHDDALNGSRTLHGLLTQRIILANFTEKRHPRTRCTIPECFLSLSIN